MNLKNLEPDQQEKIYSLLTRLPYKKSKHKVVMKKLIRLIKQTYEIENEYEKARRKHGLFKIEFLDPNLCLQETADCVYEAVDRELAEWENYLERYNI